MLLSLHRVIGSTELRATEGRPKNEVPGGTLGAPPGPEGVTQVSLGRSPREEGALASFSAL